MGDTSEGGFIFARCLGCKLDCPYIDHGPDPWLEDFAAALSMARHGYRLATFRWCSRTSEAAINRCGSDNRQVRDE